VFHGKSPPPHPEFYNFFQSKKFWSCLCALWHHIIWYVNTIGKSWPMDQDSPMLGTVLGECNFSIFTQPVEDIFILLFWNTHNHPPDCLMSKTQTVLWLFATVKTDIQNLKR
jgi:hypothetical protein